MPASGSGRRSPGCRAGALAGAAAIGARDRRWALLVTQRRGQVLHRVDQLASRLAPLGLRVLRVHGLQALGERERVEASLRDGATGVVVASAEVMAGGWAASHADRIGRVLLDGLPAPHGLPPGVP